MKKVQLILCEGTWYLISDTEVWEYRAYQNCIPYEVSCKLAEMLGVVP